MNKIKVIALYGKSSAGKDTIQNWIVQNYPSCTKKMVSYTTRPPRDYEEDGRDYYFISNEEFSEKVLNGDMLEAVEFNGWFYGSAISALDPEKINIGVYNPEGIQAILNDDRLFVIPVYIYAEDKTRLLRSLYREEKPDCAEICRRFFADEKDFENLEIEHSLYCYNEGPDFDGEIFRAIINSLNN